MTSTGADRVVPAAPCPAPAMVSIVIPCHDHAHFLADAIASALAQTHRPIEVVVVDDGSTDDPAAVVARHPEVRYLRQARQGLAAARNAGLRHARGDYLVFLDADDRLLPGAVASGLGCMRAHPESAFTSGHFRYVQGDGSLLNEYAPLPSGDDHYQAFLRSNYVAMHATVMYRRAPLERVGGFDPTLRACEDYDLYLRLSREYRVCRHREVVAEYRQHDANMSRDSGLMLSSALAVLRKQAGHVRGDATLGAALRAGVRFWRELYAEQLVGQLRREPRRLREPRQALRGAIALLRYGPKWAVRRAGAFASRVRRRLASPRVGHVRFGDLRRVTPISTVFGYDRGRPVDRYYIERFLEAHASDICGRVLEIGDDAYTTRFGGPRVVTSDVLHVDAGNPRATFVGDLTHADHLPSDAFDCVVLTQTLHIIYDVRAALATLRRILRPGGVLLATFPGISHIDQGEWGATWSWGFTAHSATRLFAEAFSPSAVAVETHGNVLVAIAFLHGLAVGDLRPDELDHHDPHYQVVITARAVKSP